MKRIVCYSGGHDSALTAIEVSRLHGTENLILLNHDINPSKEHADIKRFKQEVASYLGMSITYANCLGITEPENLPDQFQAAMLASKFGYGSNGFKFGNGQEVCTNILKTTPFYNWLKANCAPGEGVIYYGFDRQEQHRLIRRRKHLAVVGYESGYLAELPRTIKSTKELGIEPPLTYQLFKHGNCIGCLKAGLQHWYIVFCYYPDIWQQGKQAEAAIGYSIHSEGFLETLEPLFEAMQMSGVTPTEHITHQKFWAQAKAVVKPTYFTPSLFSQPAIPCECVM
jgi:hypothetical protein